MIYQNIHMFLQLVMGCILTKKKAIKVKLTQHNIK